MSATPSMFRQPDFVGGVWLDKLNDTEFPIRIHQLWYRGKGTPVFPKPCYISISISRTSDQLTFTALASGAVVVSYDTSEHFYWSSIGGVYNTSSQEATVSKPVLLEMEQLQGKQQVVGDVSTLAVMKDKTFSPYTLQLDEETWGMCLEKGLIPYVIETESGNYGSNLHSAIETLSRDAAIEKAMSVVEKAFVAVEKVLAVYMQRYRRELQFKVLLDTTKYDWDLMDELLDIEYELLKHQPAAFLFDFTYLPSAAKETMVHPSAKLVFRKSNGRVPSSYNPSEV